MILNTANSKPYKTYKEYSGILIPEKKESPNSISFLTAEGISYRILKNKKYKQLKYKIGECIRIFGHAMTVGSVPIIEIVSFVNEFDSRDVADDIENLITTDHFSRITFFDYEAIYT